MLKVLDIKEKIITIDAMGTQKGIANLIRLRQAHYVLALKKNHKRMYRKIDVLFKKIEKSIQESMVYQQKSQMIMPTVASKKGHILFYQPCIYLGDNWKDLSTYVRVESARHLPTGEVGKSDSLFHNVFAL